MSAKKRPRTTKTTHEATTVAAWFKWVFFAAAHETEWATNRKEYVPKGTFMHTFAICLAITSGLGVGYVLSRKMAGIEVDASGAICPEPCQFYHAVPHQKAKLTAVIICDAIKGRTSTKLKASGSELPQYDQETFAIKEGSSSGVRSFNVPGDLTSKDMSDFLTLLNAKSRRDFSKDHALHLFERDSCGISYVQSFKGNRNTEGENEAAILQFLKDNQEQYKAAKFIVSIWDDCQHIRIMAAFGDDHRSVRRKFMLNAMFNSKPHINLAIRCSVISNISTVDFDVQF